MSKKENNEIEDVKSNFLATMSHEMRTPMQSVYGLLELIELEDTSEHVKDMVKVAKTSASSLLEILDEVLELSKMDAGKMTLDDFEIPLRTLVRGVFEALEVKIQKRPVELLEFFGDDVPLVVKGDPKRMRQILMNLVGNALKFTESGHVRISVSTAQLDPLKLRFEITDTGIGMSEEACTRLFKPFNQADNSTSRKYGGTGLGLSICKKLVDLMNGDIGVTSTEGEGSIFWFEIPTSAVDTNLVDLDLPELGGLHVLSVEDHPQGAKEIIDTLSSMGAHVESCGSIAEALEVIKQRPFDVGLIDQGLPDGDGLSLIRQIIELRPFMGCIMYTARDDTGLRNSLQSLGVDYIAKPASRKGLGETVLDAANKIPQVSQIKGSQNLLIADDTASIRDLLSRQLKILGVEADIVENGEEVLEALEQKDYGVLITDLHMPERDGYSVIDAIRGQEINGEERLPVIVLTADIQMADRKTYTKYGFDECLLKPVTLGHFRRLLVRWGILDIQAEAEQSDRKNVKKKAHKNDAIDMKALEQQLGAIDSMAIEMLSMFVEMTEPLIANIQSESNNENLEAIVETAHSLKGSARSAGATIMGDIAYEIQELAEKDVLNTELVSDIVKEFERVKEHINSLEKTYA